MPVLVQSSRPLLRALLATFCVLWAITADAGSDYGAVEHKPAVVPPVSDEKLSSVPIQTGTASWYGGSFIGGKTASGERYVAGERTAAHRKLPFGTYVRVTNLRNRKVAVVRINNRGPFIKGRIIDLSRQAAVDLGMVHSGVARVSVEVLSPQNVSAEIAAL